jgi:ribose/xylose/arabinose/galactoside ABC-type transport system permease subunit
VSRWLLPVFLLVEIALFALVSGNPLPGTGRYWQSYFADLLAQSGPILLLGFGMTLVLMTGGIDLSVGAMTALVACIMSSFPAGPDFWWKALPVGLLAGLALGAFNGLIIGKLDVPPIIATLGTMIFYRGLCFVLMGDLEKSPFIEVPGYEFFGRVSGAVLLVAVVFLGGGAYFLHSVWRREILMIGGNRTAARYAAIGVERRLTQTYMLMGFLAFLAALCFTARNSSVSASSLSGLELHVIVAVVLGGTRVQGGSGSLLGTFFGVLFIAVLDEGLRGASGWGAKYLPFKISHLEYLLLGVLLLVGVWASTRMRNNKGVE